MAGIGFLLRRLDPYGSFTGKARVYGAAAIVSSGAWMISILGILLVGLLAIDRVSRPAAVTEFQVSVTYLMALSLITTGFLQFLLSRFTADRLYEERRDLVASNIIGALIVTTLVCGALGLLAERLLFQGTPLFYRILMISAFVTMCDLWIVVIVLTGLKAYNAIVLAFLLAYGVVVGGGLLFVDYGLVGLLGSFVAGQVILLFILLGILLMEYDAPSFAAYNFLDRKMIFVSLSLTGFVYNLAIWADKFAFWFHADTGSHVIGPLYASVVYDTPIFLAYLTIIPGMSVFLVRMETDFAEQYERFYDGVRNGAALEDLERTRDQMIATVRQGIYEIFKVQGLTIVVVLIVGPYLLDALGLSRLHLVLFYVDTVGVGAQVLVLAILNIAFYLDQRKLALRLTTFFFLCNLFFTLITQALGPAWYGYGFAFAGGVTALVGLQSVSKRFSFLVRDTFMLQGASQ